MQPRWQFFSSSSKYGTTVVCAVIVEVAYLLLLVLLIVAVAALHLTVLGGQPRRAYDNYDEYIMPNGGMSKH
jgi:hypothetical protein